MNWPYCFDGPVHPTWAKSFHPPSVLEVKRKASCLPWLCPKVFNSLHKSSDSIFSLWDLYTVVNTFTHLYQHIYIHGKYRVERIWNQIITENRFISVTLNNHNKAIHQIAHTLQSNKYMRYYTFINADNQNSRPQYNIISQWLIQCTCPTIPCTCLARLTQIANPHL